MSNLTRKKITVKSKRGKSFQRSVMVKSEAKQGRLGSKTGRNVLVGKTGNSTAFRHGLFTGSALGLVGGHRSYGIAHAAGALVSNAGAREVMKRNGQSGKTWKQRLKHVAIHTAGQALGGAAGGLIYEGGRRYGAWQ